MSTLSGPQCTSVKDFYRDRSIFITGGTGFMGKVLVEKLLRSCPGIKNIYLLMRPKKSQDVQHRLQELLNGPVREWKLASAAVYYRLGWGRKNLSTAVSWGAIVDPRRKQHFLFVNVISVNLYIAQSPNLERM